MKKRNIMLGGALGGALIGVIAAMLIARRAEKSDRETAITAGEGLKLGIMVFGLLRAIASLNDD
jgi:gas vesicle protein